MSEVEARRKIVGLILFCIGIIISTMIFAYEGPPTSPSSIEHLYWLGYSGVALAVFGFLMAISGEGWLKL